MKKNINNVYWIIILGFLLFRLAFVPFMGLMPQGAYYSYYSQNLDLSYYDHPPMIAYFLAFSFFLFGKSVFAVKLTTWIWTLGTVSITYQLSKKFYDQEMSLRNMVVLLSTIMTSILALVATPDVPLLFFWILSIWWLHKAIFEQKKWAWIAAGLAMGLAFDSKYTAIFLPACMMCFLIFSNEERKWLKTPWPYLTGLVMLAVMTPVIYWNYIHDFASFTYQGATRANTIAEEGWKPEHILGSIAMQSTVLVPVLFFFIFYTCTQYFKSLKLKVMDQTKDLFLLSFFLPVFAAFMLLSIMYWVKLNWIMPAYLTGVLFLAPRMTKRWFNAQLIFSIVLHMAIAIQLAFYVVPIKSDDTWWGWESLAVEVRALSGDHPNCFVFAGDHYKTTAQLGFHLENIKAHNVIGSHAVHYDMVEQDFSYLNGKDGLYIDSDPSLRHPEISEKRLTQLLAYFDRVELLDPIELVKGDNVVRYFRVYKGYNYQWKPGLYKAETD